MQRYESTLAEHGRVLSDDPIAGEGWGYFFERTYQGVHSDRLRGIAAILAFSTLLFALATLVALFSRQWVLACSSGILILVFSSGVWAMILTLRRRSLARRRGIRLLDRVERDRAPATPAAEG